MKTLTKHEFVRNKDTYIYFDTYKLAEIVKRDLRKCTNPLPYDDIIEHKSCLFGLINYKVVTRQRFSEHVYAYRADYKRDRFDDNPPPRDKGSLTYCVRLDYPNGGRVRYDAYYTYNELLELLVSELTDIDKSKYTYCLRLPSLGSFYNTHVVLCCTYKE